MLSLNLTRNRSFEKQQQGIDLKPNRNLYEFSTNMKIATIPEGFRPPENILIPIYCYNLDYSKFGVDVILIGSSGDIFFLNHRNFNPFVINGMATYIIN